MSLRVVFSVRVVECQLEHLFERDGSGECKYVHLLNSVECLLVKIFLNEEECLAEDQLGVELNEDLVGREHAHITMVFECFLQLLVNVRLKLVLQFLDSH
jgi:hypothetical protein